jgi:Acetyltransferases
MNHRQDRVRILNSSDIYAIERLLRTSEFIYQRFTLNELPSLLARFPAAGIGPDTGLYGFLLTQIINAPFAWISGFGVSWTESRNHAQILEQLLARLYEVLPGQGVRYLHYSGNDADHDWLRSLLLIRGFIPYHQLYAYDKFDYKVPSQGNQQVTIRPVDIVHDMPALLQLEEVCFEDFWRYDAPAFSDIKETHPYFVVAELDGEVVGYQFNTLDNEYGYLVRIAVQPARGGQGIGTRLMAEAIHFFAQAHCARIMLNTQEENHRAHRLYERFGFIRLQQKGFVLRKTL